MSRPYTTKASPVAGLLVRVRGSAALSADRACDGTIRLANLRRVRDGGDGHPDFGLLVPFDRALPGPAILFSPDERQRLTFVDAGIDHAKREHRLLVIADTAEHREADDLAALVIAS